MRKYFKSSMYFKLIFFYIIFGLVCILIIEKAGYKTVSSQVINSKSKILYDQANEVRYLFAGYHEDKSYTEKEVSMILNEFKAAYGTETLIINKDAIVTFSSYTPSLGNYLDSFDISYFGNNYSQIGDFYGYYDTERLSVYASYLKNYNYHSFIIVSIDYNEVINEVNTIMDHIYIIFILLYAASYLILLGFTIVVYAPLSKISIATKEYAKGNFSYPPISSKSSDELTELSDSINFLVNQFKTLEEDQKKFIANVSHDFRSPLTSIRGYAEAMMDGTIPSEMHEKYLSIILSESERLTKLTSNLLVLNTWDTKKGKLDLSEFDINVIIKNTLASFEGQFSRKKILVNLTLASSSYIVKADIVKIQQVLYNLIDNAIKFSNPNSFIDIDVADRNDRIYVSIKDHGQGISRENLKKIWERFYKTDSSRGKDKFGTGLGLSIVREIITSHDEDINVISTQGVGTEFIFTLKNVTKK